MSSRKPKPKLRRRDATPLRSQTPVRGEPRQQLCPDCQSPDLSESNGEVTCAVCGTIIRARNNIVSEITFDAGGGGAATVQGAFVGEGQRNAKTTDPQGHRLVGGGEVGENSQKNGSAAIDGMAQNLFIPDHVRDQAKRIYKLAIANSFIYGRRVRVVAAVTLYVACRQRNSTQPMLLIDFAEAVPVNVFTMGQTYTDLKKRLFIDDTVRDFKGDPNNPHAPIPVIEIEKVILKYAQKLEFGSNTDRVANDAASILKRMKRDWMVTGRQPSGLIGACILLAARMNNYRRTVREVVYVVKAHNVTISKRLDEFKRTESSELTVEDFRKHGLLLKRQAEPPIVYEKKMVEQRKKRMLVKELMQGNRGNPETISEHGSQGSQSRASSEGPSEPRKDAEGFAIPKRPNRAAQTNIEASEAESTVDGPTNGDDAATGEADCPDAELEISPDAEDASSTYAPSEAGPDDDGTQPGSKKRKRGRPKKTGEQRAIERARRIIQPEDLVEEHQLEEEIEDIMQKPSVFTDMSAEEFEKFVTQAKERADALRREERLMKRRPSEPAILSDGDDDLEDEGAAVDESEDATTPTEAPNTQKRSADQLEPSSTPSDVAAAPSQASPEPNTATSLRVPPRPPKKRRTSGRFGVSSDYEISESEFASDPEVAICLLSEADVRVKERIWIRDNEEWLRTQQTRTLQRLIQDKYNAANPKEGADGDGASGTGRGKRKGKGKLGDGSLIKEKGRKPRDTAEAVWWMKEKQRGGAKKGLQRPSRRINHDAVLKLINPYTKVGADEGSPDAEGSPDVGGSPAVEGTPDVDGLAEAAAGSRASSVAPTIISSIETASRAGMQEPEPTASTSSRRTTKAPKPKARKSRANLLTPDATQQDGARASQVQPLRPTPTRTPVPDAGDGEGDREDSVIVLEDDDDDVAVVEDDDEGEAAAGKIKGQLGLEDRDPENVVEEEWNAEWGVPEEEPMGWEGEEALEELYEEQYEDE